MRFLAFSSVLLVMATWPSPKRRANHPWDYEGKRGALVWGKLDPHSRYVRRATSSLPSIFAALA